MNWQGSHSSYPALSPLRLKFRDQKARMKAQVVLKSGYLHSFHPGERDFFIDTVATLDNNRSCLNVSIPANGIFLLIRGTPMDRPTHGPPVCFHPGERDFFIDTYVDVREYIQRLNSFHPGERDFFIDTMTITHYMPTAPTGFHPGERDFFIDTRHLRRLQRGAWKP